MRRVYYGWWVVGGAFLLLLSGVGTNFYAFPVFFEVMVTDMGWARTQAALAMTIGTLVGASMGILVGWLIHRIGLRLVTLCGTLVAGLGFFLLRRVVETSLLAVIVVQSGAKAVLRMMPPGKTAEQHLFGLERKGQLCRGRLVRETFENPLYRED